MAWWYHKNTFVNLDKVEQIYFKDNDLTIFFHFSKCDPDVAPYFEASFESLEDFKYAKSHLFAKTFEM